ncbi:MAG: TM2 domain-containing protein [Treponema sp.]|nr:TM2 domain-containing protein [Treponema sp.]
MYSVGIAYLLWFLSVFGLLGLHRFYLGKIPTGILWICTGGLAGFGTIYDFFTLPRQVREANYRNALYRQPPRGHVNWRNVSDGEARIVHPTGKRKESLERIILRLAKENKGILTVSEVALDAEIPIDDARKYLDNLVTKGVAELRVRKTGALVYVLADFTDRDEPLEDF